MGKFDECKRPFSPCWCESRPNNPHCKSVLPSVPLDNPYFIGFSILVVIIYAYIFFNPPVNKKLKIIKMKTLNTLFEKFYDSVSNFLSGGKSIAPNELKSF